MRNSTFWRPLVAILCLGAFSVSASDEAPPLRETYQADQVSKSVYVIHGPKGLPNIQNQGFMNNPGFVITSKGVVVIDPGSSVQAGRMVLEQIENVTEAPVVASFSTHIHGDHWLGNQALSEKYPDIKLYAHPQLITLANSGEAENWLSLMEQLTAGATRGTRAVIPTIEVNDGDVISIGNMDFAIHHKGKAHTVTDIAIVIEQEKVMFTGDLVFNHRLGRMDDGSFLGLSDTLEHLIGLSPDVVVPGHGKTGDTSIIEVSKAFHDKIYQVVEEKYEEGVPDFEIKPMVIEQLDEFFDWDGFEAGIGKVISIGYLEVEENNF